VGVWGHGSHHTPGLEWAGGVGGRNGRVADFGILWGVTMGEKAQV